MLIDTKLLSWQGKLLVATPSLTGSCFAKSVIFLCHHDDSGAMGLIVNHRIMDIDAQTLLKRFNISFETEGQAQFPVKFGGPVEMTRGFILHSGEYALGDTMKVGDHYGITSNIQVIKDILNGAGPKASMLTMGYAGWGKAQLEKELERGSWLVCDARPDIVFNGQNHDAWRAAIRSLGVRNPAFISPTSGNA